MDVVMAVDVVGRAHDRTLLYVDTHCIPQLIFWDFSTHQITTKKLAMRPKAKMIEAIRNLDPKAD